MKDKQKQANEGKKLNKAQKRFLRYAAGINAIMLIIILILLWIFSRRFIALFR